MKKGIEESDVYMLMLTENVLTRPFVLMELKHAIELEKPILLMMETDNNRFPFDFSKTGLDEQ